MTQYLSQNRADRLSYGQARESIKVFDRNRKEIGRVKLVFFGLAADQTKDTDFVPVSHVRTAPRTYPEPFIEELEEAFAGSEYLPETLRNRLIHNGFIRIDTSGWFTKDTFAMPDQIESVTDKKVMLNTTMDELMKE